MESTLKKIVDKLQDEQVDTVAIVMHNKPDGDSIGSAIALEEVLIGLDKKVDLIIHNKIPSRFAPIVGENRVDKVMLPKKGKKYDLLIMVDFADPERTIKGVRYLAKFVIVLDHHQSSKQFGNLYLCKDEAATGIIVYDIISRITKITPKIANAIYMSIVSDTTGFRNGATNQKAHLISAKMLSFGANIDIVNSIFDSKTLSYMMLIGEVMTDIEFDNDYKICYLVVTRDKIDASGATGEEVASLIEQIRWVKNAEIAYLFIEGIHNVRISARSKTTPVNKILEYFGGGGHMLAAGCAVDGGYIHTVSHEVLSYTRKFIDNNKNVS
jgi:phosphoesterase RecJ-like protein